MSDSTSKFEEDWTKIVVAIVHETFMWTDRQTDKQTDTQSHTQMILYLFNDKNVLSTFSQVANYNYASATASANSSWHFLSVPSAPCNSLE